MRGRCIVVAGKSRAEPSASYRGTGWSVQRILRDMWAWRGGLTPDELGYEPRLADARAGPISEPAWRHWPMLVSQLEVAKGVQLATGLAVREVMGPVAVHLGLLTRTGGYHAILPDRLPQLEQEYMAIREDEDDIPRYDEVPPGSQPPRLRSDGRSGSPRLALRISVSR